MLWHLQRLLRVPHARCAVAHVAVLIVLVANAASAATTMIYTCGQAVTGGRARLAADLDCSAYPGAALTLEKAALDLDGYTLIGSMVSAPPETTFATVACAPRCKIRGPGVISGGWYGIIAERVKVSDMVTVTGTQSIAVFGTNVNLRSVDLLTNGIDMGAPAVWTPTLGKVRLRNARVIGNGGGIHTFGKSVAIVDSAIEGNNSAEPFIAGSGRVGFGLYALIAKVTIRRSTVRANAPIPQPDKSRCQVVGCADIHTTEKPWLRSVVCDTSAVAVGDDGGKSWGLCRADTDFDDDGTPNELDLCDYHPDCALQDADADGIGDCCDNCPALANPDQFDDDNDGTGTACQ